MYDLLDFRLILSHFIKESASTCSVYDLTSHLELELTKSPFLLDDQISLMSPSNFGFAPNLSTNSQTQSHLVLATDSSSNDYR